MTKQSKFDIPVLAPMFNIFDTILFKGKIVSAYNYMLIGQVCIDKNYRGQGIFDNCYSVYRKYYCDKYDFAITEIASTNFRSRKAHKRIGFEELHSYLSPDKTEWIVVIWGWKKGR